MERLRHSPPILAAAVFAIIAMQQPAKAESGVDLLAKKIPCESLSSGEQKVLCHTDAVSIRINLLLTEGLIILEDEKSKGADYTRPLSANRNFMAKIQLFLRELGFFHGKIDGLYADVSARHWDTLWNLRWNTLETPIEIDGISITNLNQLKDPEILDKIEKAGIISHTQAAILRFQIEKGLFLDGVIGEETFQAIFEAIVSNNQ